VLAPGPGHSPADRSLSVKLDPNAPGGYLVHSFAGDDPIVCRDHVREKAGLPAWQPNGNGRKRATDTDIDNAVMAAIMGQAGTGRPSSPVVARYGYTDENGVLLYQVQRHEPKRFSQRKPDGNGAWTYQLGDVRRVLYRLPELLAYPDGTVFVCEGEKDADRVAALGHCATTLSGGSKWTDDLVEVLRGRDVLILQDDDEPGRGKALAAATALHGTAATVRIVKFPGAKDVSDWLDADTRNAGKFVDLCFDAPLWTPETAETSTAAGGGDGDGGGDGAREDDHHDGGGDDAAGASKRQEDDAPALAKATIVATPFAWRDPAGIPKRAWLYGRHYVRKFLTCTIAPGGLGKTSLVIGEALAMASQRPLLGITPIERARVWLWNGKDPADELQRRVVAAMIHHGLTPEDVAGYLFTDVGRQAPIILATQTRLGTTIAKPVVEAVIEAIKTNRIDTVVIDPFVKSHRVGENDNNAIDAVVSQWAAIADVTNCAIELLHHPRKTGGAEVTVEDGRGASALLSASRSARVLNRMSVQEADDAGLEKATAWRYFRVDNGKASMAPPPEKADWYQLTSVALGNGDDVGVATAWPWPDPFEGVTTHDLRAAQKEVSEGGPWRANNQASDWVGKPIAKALKLDAYKDSDKKKIKSLLKTWMKNGMFVVVDGKDKQRHPRQFVEVGTWAD
jgi:AAA domain